MDYYEKEQLLRAAVVSSLATACHPDHLKKTKCLLDKLEKHMRSQIVSQKIKADTNAKPPAT